MHCLLKYPPLRVISTGATFFTLLFLHPPILHADSENKEKIVLESPLLRVEIDPSESGRIASFFDKKRGVEHLEPSVVSEEIRSPLLPVTVTSNHGGLEDWFWKQYVAPRTDYHLLDKGESPEGPWATVGGKINGIQVERRMLLLKSLPILQVDVTLRSDSPVEASYWVHIVVAADHYLDKETGQGIVAGNFSGDTSPRQGRGMLPLKQSGPQEIPIGFGDAAFAPGGNWFARIASDRSEALALAIENPFKEQGGFFYTWQNIQTRIASLEAIWPPMLIDSTPSNASSSPAKQMKKGNEVRLRYFLVWTDQTDPHKMDALLRTFSSREP